MSWTISTDGTTEENDFDSGDSSNDALIRYVQAKKNAQQEIRAVKRNDGGNGWDYLIED